MDEIENPGARDAHGVSDGVLADASDNTASVESRQEREPKSRFELIVYNSGAALYGTPIIWCGTPKGDGKKPENPEDFYCIDAYDFVPDRARTDPAIGTVEMRERLFLTLVYIAESLVGGPPHDVKKTIAGRYKRLLWAFYPDRRGNRISLDLVKELISETLENGKEGGFDGCR